MNTNYKDYIVVKGARENNLKNVSVTIPKDSLVPVYQEAENPRLPLIRSSQKGREDMSSLYLLMQECS